MVELGTLSGFACPSGALLWAAALRKFNRFLSFPSSAYPTNLVRTSTCCSSLSAIEERVQIDCLAKAGSCESFSSASLDNGTAQDSFVALFDGWPRPRHTKWPKKGSLTIFRGKRSGGGRGNGKGKSIDKYPRVFTAKRLIYEEELPPM